MTPKNLLIRVKWTLVFKVLLAQHSFPSPNCEPQFLKPKLITAWRRLWLGVNLNSHWDWCTCTKIGLGFDLCLFFVFFFFLMIHVLVLFIPNHFSILPTSSPWTSFVYTGETHTVHWEVHHYLPAGNSLWMFSCLFLECSLFFPQSQ